MKKLYCLASVALMVVLTACFPSSIHPFYKTTDITHETHLNGSWLSIDGDDNMLWNFAPTPTNHFVLTVSENGKTGKFDAVLFKMGKERYLDLTPLQAGFATNQLEWVDWSMIPSHLLAHVSQTKPVLKVAFLDPEWVYNYVTNNPSKIAHINRDGRIVFTAATKDLQTFVARHHSALFTNYLVLGAVQETNTPAKP